MLSSNGCSSYLVGSDSINHYPRYTGAPFYPLCGPPITSISVDRGLAAIRHRIPDSPRSVRFSYGAPNTSIKEICRRVVSAPIEQRVSGSPRLQWVAFLLFGMASAPSPRSCTAYVCILQVSSAPRKRSIRKRHTGRMNAGERPVEESCHLLQTSGTSWKLAAVGVLVDWNSCCLRCAAVLLVLEGLHLLPSTRRGVAADSVSAARDYD